MPVLRRPNATAGDALCLLLEKVLAGLSRLGRRSAFGARPRRLASSYLLRSAMERTTLLLESATMVGASWAQALSDAIRQERRRVAGGFPGTIPEARFRVNEYLRGELMRLELSPLAPLELSRAVEVAYARARRDWLDMGREAKAPLRR